MSEKDHSPKGIPEFTYGDESKSRPPEEIIDTVPDSPQSHAEDSTTAPGADSTSRGIRTYGGYTNVRSHQPGTMYEPGMPLPLDVDTNPQTGHPQTPKLK